MDDPKQFDALGYLKQQVADREHKIREILIDLEMDKAVRDLHGHPGWQHISKSVAGIVESETEKLLSNRMDAFELGRRQGFIRALRILGRQAPLSDQEVAIRRTECSVLVRQNEDDLRVLQEPPAIQQDQQ